MPILTGLLDALAERFSTAISHGPDEAPRPVPLPESTPTDDVRIAHVGAWAGSSCYDSRERAKRTVALASSIGLNRLDIVVNDMAKENTAVPFRTHDLDEIAVLVELAQQAGIAVHLLAWILPFERTIAGAAAALVPFCERHQVASCCFDTEEPWTQAKGNVDYEKAAEWIGDSFDPIPWGFTGIGYASAPKLGPLARRARYGIPQCYATAGSSVAPPTAVAKLAGHWRKLFPGCKLHAGLAAYHQSGIPGYTPESALRAAFGGAQADLLIDTVVYWSFAQIRSSALVQRVLRAIIREQLAA
jgi:hypothetical protein